MKKLSQLAKIISIGSALVVGSLSANAATVSFSYDSHEILIRFSYDKIHKSTCRRRPLEVKSVRDVLRLTWFRIYKDL